MEDNDSITIIYFFIKICDICRILRGYLNEITIIYYKKESRTYAVRVKNIYIV
ncbi:MAG TPA: hypothetical protein PLE45_09830 [Spirochaetota bacterium]|nr:hypothetical protein [Spirochaetota bacterium]HOL57409.1 hypothetical protein [Spirochaetota bacterium]HPP04495.1 hypothetical protein [Spirochaetota bacterium]